MSTAARRARDDDPASPPPTLARGVARGAGVWGVQGGGGAHRRERGEPGVGGTHHSRQREYPKSRPAHTGSITAPDGGRVFTERLTRKTAESTTVPRHWAPSKVWSLYDLRSNARQYRLPPDRSPRLYTRHPASAAGPAKPHTPATPESRIPRFTATAHPGDARTPPPPTPTPTHARRHYSPLSPADKNHCPPQQEYAKAASRVEAPDKPCGQNPPSCQETSPLPPPASGTPESTL
ncbi:hypothetical protein HNY73_015598 [Argiope bruennichi]|uniref:Uncharacterized protein n=1 Tax=Argiope bruennichi TaxID=94029 RepID=A0A8T0EUJ6_ARGBR|nr:hypothetical protein HNY73_015598 [Argiope bruennichi]